MAKKDIPKTVYAAGVGYYGLYSKRPVKVKYNSDLKWWEDSKLELQVRKLGLDTDHNTITFATTDKKDVQIFINGVLAAHTLIKNHAFLSF